MSVLSDLVLQLDVGSPGEGDFMVPAETWARLVTLARGGSLPVAPPSQPRTVVLIGCAKSKLDRPAPARDLYTSALFRLSLAYAERVLRADAVFVLSALHGLVSISKELAPYNRTLGEMAKAERVGWAWRAGEALDSELGAGPARVVLLASDDYRPRSRRHEIEKPLTGKQIGERLSWLKSAIAAAEARVA